MVEIAGKLLVSIGAILSTLQGFCKHEYLGVRAETFFTTLIKSYNKK